MSVLNMRRATAAALTATMLLGAASATYAEIRDYEFRLVKKGDAELAVRLVNKKSGKPVPNAVIFAKRIDMAPDGTETMASPIEQLPSTEPGVYRFKTNLSMQGRWQLSLGAKVQGEDGSVESKLVVKMLWGGSGEHISIAALTNPMEPRHDETQSQDCERSQSLKIF
jgi:YtkA-like